MLIVLLRHGIAEEKGGGKPDEERRLTREGHEKMKRVSRALAGILPDADAIYSSPLVRAYETAEWVAKAYEKKLEIETTTALLFVSLRNPFGRLIRPHERTAVDRVGVR